ncbi:MAG: TrkH family potassium uptake protein [Spirochaetaceae bacterium]|jgi:trk system potassium uptake protein TrkH|nr:TrkH family potassium uptake protein [Spirochaetaceae bacterium]
MRAAALIRLLIVFLGFFSLTMTAPLIMALALEEKTMIRAFAVPLAASCLAALPVFLTWRKNRPRINTREGIFLVAAAWLCGSVLGAVPFRLSGFVPRFVDAVFESVSGFTTTGASIIPDVEILPKSFHLWRGMSHWLGGMGIVVLTVAIVPALGVGGFNLLKAETSGPLKEKITPRTAETAKILWLIYCGLTIIMILLLCAGGMNVFEAVIHGFSAMGSGGFSTRNGSIAAFNSPYIEWVCTIFMLVAGFNFTLVYRIIQRRFREAAANSEAKAYGLVILSAGCLAACALLPHAGSVGRALRLAFFDVASIISTTGFVIDNHNLWPPLARLAVFLLLFCGGCSGSTAGGIKIIRHTILIKQMQSELRRILWPSALSSIRLDNRPGRKDVVYSVAGFIALYFFMLFAGIAVTAASGMDLYTAINASAICIGNIGLGFGELISGNVIAASPGFVKITLSFLMIAGRLELYTVLILFTPAFWKR